MKKSKILVPAVALLALSTAAATTGTVAWFTTNTTVTANYLTAAIKSSQDLRISDTFSPYSWTTSLTWNKVKNGLVPVTPVAGTLAETSAVLTDKTGVGVALTTDPIFLTPNLENNAVNADSGAATSAVVVGNNSTNYNVVTEETAFIGEDFALKYEGSKLSGETVILTETVKGTVTFTGGGRDIDKALRLGVYEVTDKKFVVYKVATTVQETYTVTLNNITLKSGEPKDYKVFIYYEGTDDACKNANAVTNPLKAAFSFTLASA